VVVVVEVIVVLVTVLVTEVTGSASHVDPSEPQTIPVGHSAVEIVIVAVVQFSHVSHVNVVHPGPGHCSPIIRS